MTMGVGDGWVRPGVHFIGGWLTSASGVVRSFILGVLISSTLFSCATTSVPPHVENVLFISGRDGYHTYRIPALITSQEGTLLAFCEGRKNSSSDTGDIDLLLRRSTDGGRTWGPVQVVWDDPGNVCGNPCPVVDEETGTIWLFLTHNLGEDNETEIIKRSARSTRTVWVLRSIDDGLSWSMPRDVTATTKNPEWSWYATGPGVGIQIRNGPHSGRLVIPCDHSYYREDGSDDYGSHVIYSDDGGDTWHLGGVVRPKSNECQIVELADGRGTLLLNMRSYFERNRRTHAWSRDGGATWTEPRDVEALIEPVCQASLIRYSWPEDFTTIDGANGTLVFSNPASRERANLTVRLSHDDGETWPVMRTLFAGRSAYSCLAVLQDGRVGCVYERGGKTPYEVIMFSAFTLDWLRGIEVERRNPAD